MACFLARCTGSIDLEAAFREGSPGSVDRDIKQILERADMPGHMAARAGLSRVLETLIEQGFKVNGKNSEKKTSLHVAIEAEQQVQFSSNFNKKKHDLVMWNQEFCENGSTVRCF